MMMQKKWNGLAVLLLGCTLLPAANAKNSPASKHPKSAEQSTPATAEKADKEKVSYGIGVDMGRNFKRLGLDLDLDTIAEGIKVLMQAKNSRYRITNCVTS